MLTTADPKQVESSAQRTIHRILLDWIGRIVCGSYFAQLSGLMADTRERCGDADVVRPGVQSKAATRHARCALRHRALARLSLIATIACLLLVGTVILAHETHNTERIYQAFLANPGLARAPEQSWGYTPLLKDMPEPFKSRLIAFDRTIESVFLAFGAEQNRSGSSSVRSKKLSAALMSLFCLIPLVQFGLGQTSKAMASAEKAFDAANNEYVS